MSSRTMPCAGASADSVTLSSWTTLASWSRSAATSPGDARKMRTLVADDGIGVLLGARRRARGRRWRRPRRLRCREAVEQVDHRSQIAVAVLGEHERDPWQLDAVALAPLDGERLDTPDGS